MAPGEQLVLTDLLASQFGTSGDGNHDHLTDFTRPMTGSFWFVPSLQDLLDAIRPG